MNPYIINNMDFYRGTRLDDLNAEQHEPVTINTPEGVPSAQGNEPAKEHSEEQVDERIQLWMNNIKEFIRGIDVKAL